VIIYLGPRLLSWLMRATCNPCGLCSCTGKGLPPDHVAMARKKILLFYFSPIASTTDLPFRDNPVTFSCIVSVALSLDFPRQNEKSERTGRDYIWPSLTASREFCNRRKRCSDFPPLDSMLRISLGASTSNPMMDIESLP